MPNYMYGAIFIKWLDKNAMDDIISVKLKTFKYPAPGRFLGSAPFTIFLLYLYDPDA